MSIATLPQWMVRSYFHIISFVLENALFICNFGFLRCQNNVACAKGKMWKTALSILREMKEKGIEPNEVTYGVAVAACGNGGRWEKALELLDQMREMNMKINTITYNAAVSALAKAARTESKQQRRFDFKQKGGKYHATGNQPQNSEVNLLWCKTLDLLDCMESEGVLRDSFTFSSAISTCGAAGRWEEAMHLINTMKADGDRGIKPNRFAYTSAISMFDLMNTFTLLQFFVDNRHTN